MGKKITSKDKSFYFSPLSNSALGYPVIIMPPKGYFNQCAGVRTTQKIGRNDICPCGSGKKYKRCCKDKIEQ